MSASGSPPSPSLDSGTTSQPDSTPAMTHTPDSNGHKADTSTMPSQHKLPQEPKEHHHHAQTSSSAASSTQPTSETSTQASSSHHHATDSHSGSATPPTSNNISNEHERIPPSKSSSTSSQQTLMAHTDNHHGQSEDTPSIRQAEATDETAQGRLQDLGVHNLVAEPTASASASTSTPLTDSQQRSMVNPPYRKLPSAAQRRRARELATMLLSLAPCPECSRPLQEPVTLPCGHSACMSCIMSRCAPRTVPAEHEVPVLPCMSHLPPRLPLSPMTVPCPVNGCPRSAIGRGIGSWAGHRPRYGLVPTYTERLPLDANDSGPGSPPVDGFVIGVADHPYRLTVIGPQSRSKAHLFALPHTGVDTSATGAAHTNASLMPSLANSNLLRPDVTLSKAIALLKRYASSPIPRPLRVRRSPPQVSSARARAVAGIGRRRAEIVTTGRGRSLGRIGAFRGRGASSSSQSSSVGSSLRSAHLHSSSAVLASRRNALHRRSALQISRAARVLGTNESDLESGTVGGIRAVIDTESDDLYDDEDDDNLTDAGLDVDSADFADADFQSGHHAGSAADIEDEDEEDNDDLWPDGAGGAFSRPLLGHVQGMDANVKRHRGTLLNGGASETSADEEASETARNDPLRRLRNEVDPTHGDSGWTTEDSMANSDARAAHHGNASRRTGTLAAEAAAKASLSLSSKVGPSGEPLVQTVATLHSELLEVLECQLCYLLLYQPMTTPCGHTFCKPCFARSLDHGNRCPLCRADMPSFAFFQEHPPNSSVLKMLNADTATLSDEDLLDDLTETSSLAPSMTSDADPARRSGEDGVREDDFEKTPHHFGFQKLYAMRQAAIEQEEREARLSTPIFVCTLAFPGMPTILHIFEPRYRLMVRRCLESGSPRFGMVLPSKTNGGLEEFGTMLEIKSVQMLADGRSMLETVGSYRFRLLEKGSLDGYTVGRVERLDDISPAEEAELERAAMLRRKELDRKKQETSAPDSSSCEASSTLNRSGRDEAQDADAPSAGAQDATESGDHNDLFSLFRQPAARVEDVMVRSVSSSSSNTAGVQTPRSGSDREHDPLGLPFAPLPAEPSMAELVEICTSFIETLRSGSAPWLLSRLNHTYGPMPEAHEVERLGYWMALVMPIDEHEKAKLLPITSRRLRLCLVVHWIEQLRQSWWFNNGCTVS